ncbi:MAG: hypothetical protein AAFX50_21840, partial [Acidobacteriota bacterium]
MEISDDLARAYRGRTEPEDRGDCPGADELMALVEGTLDDARRDEILDHLVACSACAAEVRVAREAMAFLAGGADAASVEAGPPATIADLDGSPAPASARGRTSTRPRAARRRRRWIGLAAMLLMASGLWWLQSPSEPPGAGGAVRTTSPATAVAPAPGDVLASAPGLLAWPAQPGAEGYRVEVFDSTARPLWRSSWLDGPSSPLPPELVEDLAVGSFLWRVEVRGP